MIISGNKYYLQDIIISYLPVQMRFSQYVFLKIYLSYQKLFYKKQSLVVLKLAIVGQFKLI